MPRFVQTSLCGVLLFMSVSQLRADDRPLSGKFAIVIHGGAGSSPDRLTAEQKASREESLRKALTVGRDELQRGGTALDAVEKTIRILEDDPEFNAGRGAVFNAEGKHELDASIMDGKTHACGAVTGVKTVKNPIGLARLVMTQTKHVLLSAEGAEKFADEQKVDRVDNTYFSSDARRAEWKRAQAKKAEEHHKGTVGCVALDQHGDLAAGTSTGGLTNKLYGRVGDTPIIGAGNYADNETCGISGTGIGEQFIRNSVGFDVSARMKYLKCSLADAVKAVIDERLRPGDGGVIAISKDGEIVTRYNTEGMAQGSADHTGRFEVRLKDERP